MWTPWLHPIAALVAICIITSLLLSVTNMFTAPRIEQNSQDAANAARRQLLPDAGNFTEIPIAENTPNVTAMYEADGGLGWIVEAYGQGYAGQVPAMVAFSPDGTIAGVVFLENSETPGLGKLLTDDPTFASQFTSIPIETISPTDVDKIANATISTNAAITAINAAIDAFNQQLAPANASGTAVAQLITNPAASILELTLGGIMPNPTAPIKEAD